TDMLRALGVLHRPELLELRVSDGTLLLEARLIHDPCLDQHRVDQRRFTDQQASNRYSPGAHAGGHHAATFAEAAFAKAFHDVDIVVNGTNLVGAAPRIVPAASFFAATAGMHHDVGAAVFEKRTARRGERGRGHESVRSVHVNPHVFRWRFTLGSVLHDGHRN